MHFEGEFRVPGKARDVIRRFADVPRMSTCMPGAVLEPQAEDGSWPGRAEAARKFVAGKLTFAGMPRPSFRARREGTLLAGSSHRESPRKSRLCDSLLTLIAPDSMRIAGEDTHLGR